MTENLDFLDYETLTESIEDLETKRQDLDSLDQSHDRLETMTEYLSIIERSLWSIDNHETLETKEIKETGSEIDSSVSELTDLILILSQTDPLSFILQSEKVREYIEYETSDLEDLEKTKDLITLTEGQVIDLTETLEDIDRGLKRVRSHLIDSSDFSFDSLSDLRILSYFDQTGLFSESKDNIKRIDRTLSQMSDIIEDLEIVSDCLDSVSQTVKSFSEEIDLRVKRLDQRVNYYETLETDQIISDQLKENTGQSFLDSGGYPQYDSETGQYIGSTQGYGRGYERNMSRDFESEDRVSVDIGSWGLTVSIETFSFMRDCLDFDPVIMGLFMEYDSLDSSQYWRESISKFIETLDNLFSVTGIYGEGQSFGVNTYNHDSLLSQVIQYDFFSLPNGQSYVLLQTHNGSDVRGGYSRPIVYSLSDYDQTGLLRDSEVSIYIDPDPEIKDKISEGHIYGRIESGYNVIFDSLYNSDLETLCPQYDWTGKKRSEKVMTLESEIDRLEDLIKEYVTYRDSESESDRQTLDSLMTILNKKREDLETLTDWRTSRGSLSLDSFVCIDRDDLKYMDSEEIVSEYCQDDRPKIVYWTDRETGQTLLKVMSLGLMSFDFYID